MRRLFALLIVIGAGGFLVYRYVITSPETRSCQKLAELCGPRSGGVAKCARDLEQLKTNGSDATARFNSCVGEARTCGEGAGCLVGAGFSAAGAILNDFVKGVDKALNK